MALSCAARTASLLLASVAFGSQGAVVEPASVALATRRWMDTVVVQSDPTAVARLFCEDGLLVATAGVGIRMQNSSEDGWGAPKPAGTTIESYFDWFATLPEQNITRYHNNVEKISDDVWVDNAWVNWTWQGNPGLVARMTFVFRASAAGDLCIFELHSSQLPEVPERRRLRGSMMPPSPRPPADATFGLSAQKVAGLTGLWMYGVVNQSDPQVVDDLFCDDGILVATAGVGLRFRSRAEDGWGKDKPEGTTIKSYFEWFARLPEQNITGFHHNIAKVSDDVWVNNAWVNWVWSGNPGLTARMTFIVRAAPSGPCIFELHSSQLPPASAGATDEDEKAAEAVLAIAEASGEEGPVKGPGGPPVETVLWHPCHGWEGPTDPCHWHR